MSPVSVCCPGCGIGLETSALSCPGCGRLTRSGELQTLSGEAQAAAAAGNLAVSRNLWERAASLLPPETLQYRSVHARIADLDARIAAGPPPDSRAGAGWSRRIKTGLGPAALIVWKFKTLLFGLTKLSTLFSMFAFFGVYWALYGWRFALGLVLSIYVHEMGHVIAIRGFGMPASAPMFIPGFGAFISLRAVSITPVQDARIGLAGPVYGLGAALFSLALFAATGSKIFGVVAHFAALMNLFNLIPVWQLDGARGLRSLTQPQRMMLLACAGVLFLATRQGMLMLLALGLTYRLFTKDAASEPDQTSLMQYAGLLVALSAVMVFAPLG